MKSKVCNRCGVEKVLEEFNKKKTGKYGRRAQCKACRKEHYKANKEEVLKRNKQYREKRYASDPEYKEVIAARNKAYREANKDKLASKKKAYREANKEAISKRRKVYYKANKEKEAARTKAWYEANKERVNESNKAYNKKRYAEDPAFRTMNSLRKQTSRLGDYKSKTTIEIVGISAEEFWRRNGSPTAEQLEDLHIDHIVPLSWFDLTNEDHVRVSSHWTNFQYLSEEDNLIKNNNYAGRPDAILGYKEDFDIQKHVQDMIEFINATKYILTMRYFLIVNKNAKELKQQVGLALSLQECEQVIIDTLHEVRYCQNDEKFQFVSRNQFGELTRVAFYQSETAHQSNINWAIREGNTYEITEL